MKSLYPNAIESSILNIKPQYLCDNNIKALLLDIDNTMKPHYDKYPSDEVLKWFETMKKEDIKLCIVSNGHQERVDVFSSKLGIMAIGDAMKPSASGFERAANHLAVNIDECAVIGDQIFTDILGGNRAGMFTILVEPVSNREPWWVKIKRVFEVPFRKVKK